jgi:hypothetical protein
MCCLPFPELAGEYVRYLPHIRICVASLSRMAPPSTRSRYNRSVVSRHWGVSMSDCCELRQAIGVQAECDGESCLYWRAVDHLGLSEEDAGCAIQRFRMLDGNGDEVAAWLHSVKERVEAQEQAARSASA